MIPKVLIIEELHEKTDVSFNGYATCCIILGYPYQVCHNRTDLPEILETFKPDIVFWISYYEEKFAGVDYYKQMRQQEDLKVVLAYDLIAYSADMSEMADFILDHADMIDPKEFQYVISELLFTNLYDKSSTVKWVKFDSLNDLSENALRTIAAEKMWPGELSSLEWFIERQNKGIKLIDKSEQRLAELAQKQELLRQRKEKAVEILIARGITESVDELMNPEDSRPNYRSLDLLFPQ